MIRKLAGDLAALLIAAAAATVSAAEVRDDLGNRVVLSTPAQRIVTLSPHATELVFAAGAGDRLVAVAPYSDYPAQARALPTIGGLGGIDRERLLMLAPDLVIGWASGNRPADIAWLRRTGIAVYLSEPRTLDDIAASLRDIGSLAGTAVRAEQAAKRFERALASACPEPLDIPVIIQLSARPLLTVGRDHWLNDALSRAGMHNTLADTLQHVHAINSEALAAHPGAHVAYLDTPGNRPDKALTLTGATPVPLPEETWSRPGPRLARGVANVCRHASSLGSGESGRLGPVIQTTSHSPQRHGDL